MDAPAPQGRGRADPALPGGAAARCLHRATRRPAAARGRDLVPGRPARRADEDLRDTALREAEEEIGLAAGGVEIVGALPPTGTFVTNYVIYPFVGLIEPGERLRPQADRGGPGRRALAPRLVAGFERKRLIRRACRSGPPPTRSRAASSGARPRGSCRSLLERLRAADLRRL